MKIRKTKPVLLLVALLVLSSTWLQAQAAPQMIDVGGRKLRAQIEGQPRAGQPAVVFVSGLGGGLEDWRSVQPAVSQFAQAVVYERAGLGQSEADDSPPTPRRIATQLRTLLQNAGIKPPYVLVGHSIGGAHIRMFAGLYPSEVAGLVYVDPSDFTQTRADQLAIMTELGLGEAGLNAMAESMRQQFAQAPPALRAEAEVSLELNKSGWADFQSLPPVPDIPVVILMAGQVDIPPQMKEVMGRQRIEHLARWAVGVSAGTLVFTTRSGHYIQHSEPELVTWAIRRALRLDH
jgi:pimeloyl-ACP methyl ester carboxylesterase